MGQEYYAIVQIIVKADHGKAIAWCSVSCKLTCYYIETDKNCHEQSRTISHAFLDYDQITCIYFSTPTILEHNSSHGSFADDIKELASTFTSGSVSGMLSSIVGFRGHTSIRIQRNSGPFIHRSRSSSVSADSPLERSSPGLDSPLTYLHWVGSVPNDCDAVSYKCVKSLVFIVHIT